MKSLFLQRTLLLAAATVLASVLSAGAAPAEFALFPDPVVARGKGFEIKNSELEEAFVNYKGNAAALGDRIPEERRDALEASLLEEMIVTRIILAKATDEDLSKAKTAAADMLQKIKDRATSEQLFKMRLRALGLTVAQFEKQVLEQEIRKTVVRREIGAKVTITPEEVKKFFDDHTAEFDQPEKVRVRHIQISLHNPVTRQLLPPEKRIEKEALIKKLKERADGGEDFARLAREFSEDASSREQGGEYVFARGEVVKPFETAAFSLAPKQISDIVQTPLGYHIVQLLEKIPAQKTRFEEAAVKIEPALRDQAISKRLDEYYEGLRKEFAVEILRPVTKKE